MGYFNKFVSFFTPDHKTGSHPPESHKSEEKPKASLGEFLKCSRNPSVIDEAMETGKQPGQICKERGAGNPFSPSTQNTNDLPTQPRSAADAANAFLTNDLPKLQAANTAEVTNAPRVQHA